MGLAEIPLLRRVASKSAMAASSTISGPLGQAGVADSVSLFDS
jgi:hypothetical protein